MKNFMNRVLCFLESLGRARAASELARHGLHQEARRVMLAEGSCGRS